MKLLKILFVFVIALSVFSACKKSNHTVPSSELTGTFEGKYGTGTSEPSSFFSFIIKQNGTLEEVNNSGAVIGTGTWSISGKTFYANATWFSSPNSKFAYKAIYDAPEKTFIGTWGYGGSHNDGGIWHMTKKN